MFLGMVIGTVWATCKDESLEGLKFQIVKKVDTNLKLLSEFTVAVDSVGAGPGEIVMVASGSSARLTSITHDKPVDAVIMAIIDKVDVPDQ